MSLVVDTSAVIAVLLDEPEGSAITQVLDTSNDNVMSAASLIEAMIVAESRLGPGGGDLVQRFIREAAVTIVPVTADTALDAVNGWRAYGKGRHPAALNYGDCFTYALAQRRGNRVLCTGADFALTDMTVEPARDN